MKETVSIRLISKSTDLPVMHCQDFFHSTEFFKILENTPHQDPCMALAEDGQGEIIAHMLNVISCHRSLFPPFKLSHVWVYGEGEYSSNVDKERIFSLFLNEVTAHFSHKQCLYIQFSDLSGKMFGYNSFRHNGFFPIPWQGIHNSLHSMPPEMRLPVKTQEQISDSIKRGVECEIINNESPEFRSAIRLLRHYSLLKPGHSLPSIEMLEKMLAADRCIMIATTYKKRVIGTCVCILSASNAYMWLLASRRKTYMMFHPDTYTVWSALSFAYKRGYRHMYFLDAGITFKPNSTRDFILEFGGKPVSKYRWVRFPVRWINKLFDWCYND